MKNFDQYFENFEEKDESLDRLVRKILDACKMDVDAVEESDPEFIPYISEMIEEWYYRKTKTGSQFQHTPINYDAYHDSSRGGT